jgi:hypothetical protein
MSILFGLSMGAKLLGLGGGTGLLGFGARLLGWDRKAFGLAKRVPPKVWYARAGVPCVNRETDEQSLVTRGRSRRNAPHPCTGRGQFGP